MARSQQGIEIYVRDCSLDRIQDWIQTVLGAITPVDQVNEMSMRIHEAYHAGQPIPIVITSGVADGSFTSVWFNALDMPWATDAACARQAARALGCEVRCNPGLLGSSPYSDECLRIVGDREEVVVWDC
ncbi:MAG TPA: hypothetical protein VFM49_07015 [Chloroflexia bacterium]|jgi:hypothetical protein|nr:hypothetical protein [Chloroflexia bacterium]